MESKPKASTDTSDYAQRKRAADEAYQVEYAKWFESQSPDEQEKLRKLGLDRPERDVRSYATGFEHDASEDADAAPEPDVFEDDDQPTPASVLPSNKPDEAVQDAIRLIVSGLTSSQNIRVDAIALAFASGLSICSVWGSQSEAARHFGIMRQHLNKAVRKWRDMLCLPQNPYTSSEDRRKKLSKAQKTKHWRHKKQAA